MVKLLIIDDEAPIRKLLKKFLRMNDFEVVTAENGKEGLYIYKQEQPDLVITDLIMPDKEGLETIRELKQMNPSAKIIAISGGGISSPTAYLDLAQKMGAAATFEKPLDNEALLSMVKKLIDLSG